MLGLPSYEDSCEHASVSENGSTGTIRPQRPKVQHDRGRARQPVPTKNSEPAAGVDAAARHRAPVSGMPGCRSYPCLTGFVSTESSG